MTSDSLSGDDAQPTLEELFRRAAMLNTRRTLPVAESAEPASVAPEAAPSCRNAADIASETAHMLAVRRAIHGDVTEAAALASAAFAMIDAMWESHVTVIRLARDVWNLDEGDNALNDAAVLEPHQTPERGAFVHVDLDLPLSHVWLFPRAGRCVLQTRSLPSAVPLN
jgi:hypothetical protein